MGQTKRTGHVWVLVELYLDRQRFRPSDRRLAKQIGVSPSGLAGWKFGEAFPNPENMRALALGIETPYRMVLTAALRDNGYLDGPAVIEDLVLDPLAEHAAVREPPDTPQTGPSSKRKR